MLVQWINGWLLSHSGLFNSIAFFGSWLILWLPIAIPIAHYLQWQPPHPLTGQQKLSLLIPLYLLVPLLLGVIPTRESRPLSDYGLRLDLQVFLSLVVGVSLGLLTLFIGYGLQIVWGGLQWQPSPRRGSWVKILVPIFGLSLWISGTEEAVFRGFLLTELEKEITREGAAIISSTLFALSHLIWDIQGGWRQLPGLGLMGGVLALARWVDGGNLGLAWGLHTGWIWGLMGLEATDVLKKKEISLMPWWVSGLDGQPLSGLMGILIMVITGLMLRLSAHQWG